jgi:hypothetical protein
MSGRITGRTGKNQVRVKSNCFISCLLFIGIFFLVQGTGVYAGNGDPVERLWMVHDRELYLDGDTIWLKITGTDARSGKMLSLSSTAYVELVGRGEQLVARTKIPLSNATGCGWILIPEGLLSGNYYLRAYTSWMKNGGPGEYAYSMVSVVNPFQPLYHSRNRTSGDTVGGSGAYKSGSSEFQKIGESEKEMKLSLDMGMEKTTFRRGEPARLSIRVSDMNNRPVEAHLSASVYFTDTSLVKSRGLMIQTGASGLSAYEKSHLLHYPELTGAAVSGRVLDRNTGEPVSGTLITCTSLGQASRFQVFRTGLDGRFRFVPRTEQAVADLVFHVPGKDVPIDIIPDDPYYDRFPEISLPVLQLEESHLSYVEQLSVNRQVTEQYENAGKPAPEHPGGGNAFFYGQPSETVDLEDYIRLPVMEEVFRELVRTVILYRSGGEMKLGIIDAVTIDIIGENPLFLLDGVPLEGHGAILGLDPSLLRFIRVVDSRYFVGEMEFDGIIDLESDRGDYRDFELPSSTVLYRFQGATTNCRDHSAPGDPVPGSGKGDHQPDFRTLLYWNPEFLTGAGGTAEISFSTPDVPGSYQVVVEGVTRDGTKGRALQSFKVK